MHVNIHPYIYLYIYIYIYVYTYLFVLYIYEQMYLDYHIRMIMCSLRCLLLLLLCTCVFYVWRSSSCNSQRQARPGLAWLVVAWPGQAWGVAWPGRARPGQASSIGVTAVPISAEKRHSMPSPEVLGFGSSIRRFNRWNLNLISDQISELQI